MALNITLNNSFDHEEEDIIIKTTRYLWKIGGISLGLSPKLSSFYVKSMHNIVTSWPQIELGPTKKLEMTNCLYCGAIWSSENRLVRTRGRGGPKLTKSIRELFKLNKAKSLAILLKRKRKLRNYQGARNKFVHTCLFCHKKTKIVGNQKLSAAAAATRLIPSESNVPNLINKTSNLTSTRREKRNWKKKFNRDSKMFQVEASTKLSPKIQNLKSLAFESESSTQTTLNASNSPISKRKIRFKDVLASELGKNASPKPHTLADFLQSIK